MKHVYFLFLFITAFGFSQLSPPSDLQVYYADVDFDQNANDFYSVNSSISDNEIKIYPNPVSSGYFYVSSRENLSIQIFDVLGKLVAEREMTPAKKEVNVSNLNKGVYLVKLKSSKQSTTRKLIIN